jgi:hypothetical protein
VRTFKVFLGCLGEMFGLQVKLLAVRELLGQRWQPDQACRGRAKPAPASSKCPRGAVEVIRSSNN